MLLLQVCDILLISVATSIVISGDTFRIPDSIMGLTFLAAGMSVPEAVSSVIVANQGNFLLFVLWLIDIVLTGISTD